MDAAIHSPTLVNGLGHLGGVIAFAAFLVLLYRSARLSDRPRLSPASAAAALALLWNLGSLLVLLADPASWSREIVASVSFAVLSLLPGVLLHLALGPRYPWLRALGYVTGSVAAVLHLVEALGGAEGLHQPAIDLITYGFGGLAVVFVVSLLRGQEADRRGPAMRASAAMSLFLLAASFVHFEAEPGPASWTHELIFHHAAIPLALFVLLQDHRFLLLDAFVRWLGAALLAGLFAGALVAAGAGLGWVPADAIGPAGSALLIVGGGVAILAYPRVRDWLGARVEATLFPRGDMDAALAEIGEADGLGRPFVEQAAETIAEFAATRRWALAEDEVSAPGAVVEALESGRDGDETPLWAEVRVALRTPAGRNRSLWLGPREGGRRYLGADLEDLQRLATEAAERLDVLRREEQQRLLGEAELQALRAQINPHFLFNAFNALYGAIPRSVTGARRTLLDLTEILRYSLDGQRQYVALEEELRVVEAYLAIERLRLQDRLSVRIDCDEAARGARIPAFTIQPLVENAVKHGISEKTEGGEITVEIRMEGDGVSVAVRDDGVGFDAGAGSESGHGLQNVRRRLELCYGEAARFEIESSPKGTRATFQAPIRTGA